MVTLNALPLTETHGLPGEAYIKEYAPARFTVYCSRHGAMLRVSPDKLWYRCATCNIGVEWSR